MTPSKWLAEIIGESVIIHIIHHKICFYLYIHEIEKTSVSIIYKMFNYSPQIESTTYKLHIINNVEKAKSLRY